MCTRRTGFFSLLGYWFFTSSTGDLFLSQPHTHTLTHNSKLPTTIWNSFSVTEPFHFRLARNCYAYTVHTHTLYQLGSKETIYGWTFEDVLCAHGFLGISSFGRQFMVWKVLGSRWVSENTTHLLHSRRRRRLLTTNNFNIITNGNHKYNCPWLLKIWCPGNVFAIICRKYNSFGMFFYSAGHFSKQKLNL